jgi:hypothetical protein
MKKIFKTFCFIVPSDFVAKNFICNGALSHLKQHANLIFLVSKSVSLNFPGEKILVEPALLRNPNLQRLDLLFWYHNLYMFNKKLKLKNEDNFKLNSLSSRSKKIHSIISIPFISSIIDWLDNNFFSRDPRISKLFSSLSPDLVIVPGVAIDSYSNMFLKTAVSMSIPSLMIIAHWDYFTKKGILRSKPQKLFVWGQDMVISALRNGAAKPDDVQIIGVSHFEKYVYRKLPKKSVAIERLGLDKTCRWFFFPGAGLPYDELAVLERLDNYLCKNNIKNIRIFYRPHPKAWKRTTSSKVSIQMLSNVTLDESNNVSDDYYRDIMSSADGIISPYSTMILEGGLCGIPSLCIGFRDDVNNFDWSKTNLFDHLIPLQNRNWITICKDSRFLEKVFGVFLEKKTTQVNRKNIILQTSKTVFFDKLEYGQRLVKKIKLSFPDLIT